MRVVINAVRGKKVPDALNILHFMPQKATRTIELTIQSAVYNLLEKFRDERPDQDQLVIREIRVDGATMFKRHQSAPRGRAHPILKRTSHLTVVVGTPVNGRK